MSEQDKNYQYYDKRIIALTSENAKLQESISKMSKELLAEKTRAYNNEVWFESEHKKALKRNKVVVTSLSSVIILLLIPLSVLVVEAKKQSEPQHSKEFISLQNKTDSIFTGSYPLYPTDTAFMHICNSYGDTLQVMVTSKH